MKDPSGFISQTGEDQSVPRILNNRYEIVRELGRGGMSVVYLASDRQLLEKYVAVKVLLETNDDDDDPWRQRKFQQEMEALSRIDHPGVVGVLDSGFTPEGQRFLVMQYIDGITLRGVIEPGGISYLRAAGLIRQIGQALAAAHNQGVWHRDLKPENLMLQRLGDQDYVKLIDFGIASIQNSRFSGETTQVVGSLAYMAPEQLAGHACAASDTYALAVVTYELLTGKRPFSLDWMGGLVNEETLPAVSTSELGSGLPEAAWRAIRRALSLHPEHRQAGVLEFSEELFHALTSAGQLIHSADTVEMAHVLFIDVVGYSLLPMEQQKQCLADVQQAVRKSPYYRKAEAAGDLITLGTGDGVVLAFFGDPTAPAHCTLELGEGLKSKPHLKVRMGIHSGPVYRITDMNGNPNLSGDGINMAQRVMDCGDSGHVLVSKSVADVLLQFSQWQPLLTNLGECTVKHGIRVQLWTLVTNEMGNPELPAKMKPQEPPKPADSRPPRRWSTFARVVAVLIPLLLLCFACAYGGWFRQSGTPQTSSQNLQHLPRREEALTPGGQLSEKPAPATTGSSTSAISLSRKITGSKSHVKHFREHKNSSGSAPTGHRARRADNGAVNAKENKTVRWPGLSAYAFDLLRVCRHKNHAPLAQPAHRGWTNSLPCCSR